MRIFLLGFFVSLFGQEALSEGFLSQAPQAPVHLDGAGALGNGSNASGASDYPYGDRFAKKEKPCRILCGPNAKGYELRYSCLRAEGQIKKDGFTLKLFRLCRRNDGNIHCGADADESHFTIFGEPYTRANATHQEKSLGAFACHG